MNFVNLTALLVLWAFGQGCASTLQAKPEHYSASFNDAMKSGAVVAAVVPHVHATEKVDWPRYDKIILKPVTVSSAFAAYIGAGTQAELNGLAKAFHDMLLRRLSREYAMVEQPTDDAMLIEVGIVHAERSWIAPAFVSKVSWQIQALNSIWTYCKGKPAFSGEATIDFTVKDSVTGTLLFAGADRRVGGQNLFNKQLFNSWGDAENSLEFWTEQAAYHLCRARAASNCAKPKA